MPTLTIIAESGLSLKATIYQPDGTLRAAKDDITEVETSGVYQRDVASMESGDLVQVEDADGVYQGGGVYQPQTGTGGTELSSQITCAVVSVTDTSRFVISGDALAGSIIDSVVLIESAASGDKAFRYVKSHNEATGQIVLDRALPFTPQAGDAVYIIGYLWKSKVMA